MELEHQTVVGDVGDVPKNSVHAIVVRLSYDSFDGDPCDYQEWCREWAELVRERVKPGGHMFVLSKNESHHRLFTAIEEAGFEIRDTVTWHRDLEGMSPLYPSSEFAVLARRSLGEDTVVDNVLRYGTGALNIGGCRVGNSPIKTKGWREGGVWREVNGDDNGMFDESAFEGGVHEGRYPGNVVFDEGEGERLDERVGPRPSDGIDFSDTTDNGKREKYGTFANERDESYEYDDDHDGPSRYFVSRTTDSDFLAWVVRLLTAEGQWVLDPFGSDVVLEAVDSVDRRCVGVDMSFG